MEATWLKQMESGVNPVLVASYQATVLALIVLATTWLFRDRIRANWRFALWLIVFARLASPWIPQSPTSVYSVFPQWSQSLRPAQQKIPDHRPLPVPLASPIQSKPTPIAPGTRPELPAAASAPAMSTIVSPFGEMPPIELKQPVRTPWTIAQGALMIWLAGIVLLLLRLMMLHLRLFFACRGWQLVDDPGLIKLFEECRAESQVRGRVTLRVCEHNIGPATFGILRASIVLPRRLMSELSRDQLRLVLLHELMHVRRRDALIDLFATTVSAVHWFNPIAWLALSRLHHERELACDAALLDLTNDDQRQTYGTTILRAVELLQPVTSVSGAISMLTDRATAHGLDDRIRSIARHRRSSRRSLVVGAGAVLGMLMIGMTDQTASSNDREATATSTKKSINIEGQCRDENKRPLPKVHVKLYRDDSPATEPAEVVAETFTDSDGRYQFSNVPAAKAMDQGNLNYVATFQLEGRASWVEPISNFETDHQQFVIMPPAAELRGRILNKEGNPIAGARVSTLGMVNRPIEGVLSAKSDADGRYRIRDV